MTEKRTLSRPLDALKASEARYRRLFESAMDGILILDADSGLIVDANPFLETLLGYTHDEFVGKTLWEIGPFHDVAASREAFLELQANEYVRYENLPLETRAKELREVEFISNVYLVDGQRVIQCNIRDITERRQAARELQAANEVLAALVTELRQRDADMQLLHRISALLQACHTQEEVCQVIDLMAGDLFMGQDGCLAILRPGSPDLETVATWGRTTLMDPNFAPHDCWGFRRGQPHEVAGPGAGLLCRHFNEKPAAGYLCIPLTVQGESLGLLCLAGDPLGSETRFLSRSMLARTLSEAIKLSLFNLGLQEKLQAQSTRDPLTGLFNRRYLEDSLDRELHRARRQKSDLGVAMIDLDRFKLFNDAYGHEAGDLLLRQVGNIFQTELRQSDIACRYGGEEFVLVFPGSSFEDTCRRVEDVRARIRCLSIRHDDRHLGPVTASAGVAVAPDDGATTRSLLAAADKAMYVAKLEGRDRLACSGGAAPGLPPPA